VYVWRNATDIMGAHTLAQYPSTHDGLVCVCNLETAYDVFNASHPCVSGYVKVCLVCVCVCVYVCVYVCLGK
jgi:hypothetical protein